MIERIPVIATEFSDKNLQIIYKIGKHVITPADVWMVTKLNEIIDTINKMNKGDINYE